MTTTMVDAPLLVNARQAAEMLAISERTLWTLTDRGDIPVIRIGRAVRYDPADLRRWVEANKNIGQKY
jgi:excisionase family DNA binding protein